MIDIVEVNRSQPKGVKSSFGAWERTSQALRHVPYHDVRLIVDVGCWDGRGSIIFKMGRPDARLIGVECVSERALEARAICDEVHECLLQDAPVGDEIADVVYAGEVIEHVPLEAVEEFIEATHRILCPGGTLILTTPNPRSARLWMTGRSVLDDPSHLSQWNVGQLKALLKRHDFRVRHVEGTGRASRKIGTIWPIVPMYGSYMVVAERH